MSTWARLQEYVVDYADATYASIKDAASRWTAAMRREPESATREYGVADMLAMSANRDPFYMGAPATVAAAEWFMEVWYQQGMDRRAASGRTVYVRTMHYTATADDPLERITPPKPPWAGGRDYENTNGDYERMVSASVAARYLGLLPFDAVIDNRNKSSVYRADEHPFQEETPEVYVSTYATKVDEIVLPDPDEVTNTPALATTGYIANQRYLLSVVAEKESVYDLILPVLQRMQADFIVAKGETSLTQTFEFCQKALHLRRSARVFYLSDYDPAGNDMPMVVARRIEWFVHSPQSPLYEEFQTYLDEGHDVTLAVIAITKAQKERYHLGTSILKAKVMATRLHWQAEHGERGVELDQFDRERLNGVLAGIIRDALAPFYDSDLAPHVSRVERAADRYVAERNDELLEPHRERLDALQEEYRTIYDEVMPRLDAIRAAIEEELERVEDTLEGERAEIEEVVQDDYPVPVAAESDVDGAAALLWTERSYNEQLLRYKAHLNRLEPGKSRGGGADDAA